MHSKTFFHTHTGKQYAFPAVSKLYNKMSGFHNNICLRLAFSSTLLAVCHCCQAEVICVHLFHFSSVSESLHLLCSSLTDSFMCYLCLCASIKAQLSVSRLVNPPSVNSPLRCLCSFRLVRVPLLTPVHHEGAESGHVSAEN